MTPPGSSGSAERWAQARSDMADELARSGTVSDPAVLRVMRQVPREAFAPRFWAPPPDVRNGTPADVREWRVTEDGDDALRLVYDTKRALAIRRDPQPRGPAIGAGVTSAVSAPNVVGMMLELLHVEPGMSILEIGAGSGYNAALLAELAGPGGSVTSVDIDAGLAAETSARIAAAGYGQVRVLAADGYFGVPEHAPFDRVVATVGCTDVAPAWVDQLTGGGFCLLPLEHGGVHPLTRVEVLPGEVTGAIVGCSSFVVIQGCQARPLRRRAEMMARPAGHALWPRAGRLGPSPDVEWAPLPETLAAGLRPEPGQEDSGETPTWGLAYLLALEDPRAAHLLSLADEGSSAAISASEGRVGWTGPGGPALRDRLLEIGGRWLALGRPPMGEYRSVFRPLAAGPPAGAAADCLQWVLRRHDFTQLVSLGGG